MTTAAYIKEKKKKVPRHYRDGANFERRVKAHLESELEQTYKGTSIKHYIIRAAGSRGHLDLVILLTNTALQEQEVIGIQCKIKRPSYIQMKKFISKVLHKTGVRTYYAFKQGRVIDFYPPIHSKEEFII